MPRSAGALLPVHLAAAPSDLAHGPRLHSRRSRAVHASSHQEGGRAAAARTMAVPWRRLARCQRTTLCTTSTRFGAPHTRGSSLPHSTSSAARRAKAAGGGAHGTMAVHSRSSSDRSTQASPGVPADAAAQAAQWGSASAAIAAARRGLSPAARPAGSSAAARAAMTARCLLTGAAAASCWAPRCGTAEGWRQARPQRHACSPRRSTHCARCRVRSNVCAADDHRYTV